MPFDGQREPYPATVTGLLLAAGGGRRAGGPKALRRDASGRSWLLRAVGVLLEGGCADVVVVLGAGAAEAAGLLAAEHPANGGQAAVRVVREAGWAEGLSRSLRRGLETAGGGHGIATLVHLVDLPDVSAAVVGRVLSAAPVGPTSLARAAYGGRPGHPVLIGHDHLPAVLAGLSDDGGARDYLERHGALLVECGDLAGGEDVDGPPAVAG